MPSAPSIVDRAYDEARYEEELDDTMPTTRMLLRIVRTKQIRYTRGVEATDLFRRVFRVRSKPCPW